jgi:hypothetical protein
MIVAYSSELYPTPPGRLADASRCTYSSFSTYPAPGWLRSRLPACGPHCPPSQRRSMPPTGPSSRYTASHGSSHRPGAAPRAPGPTLSPAARRRALCLGVVWCRSCGPSRNVITQRQHTSARAANATSSPTSAIGTARHDASGSPAPLPTRHAQSSSLLPAWLRHPVSPAAQPASKLEGTST